MHSQSFKNKSYSLRNHVKTLRNRAESTGFHPNRRFELIVFVFAFSSLLSCCHVAPEFRQIRLQHENLKNNFSLFLRVL